MTALASLLGGLITALQVHPICHKVTVIETKEFSSCNSEAVFAVRVSDWGVRKDR